jgi:hypothetical protein
VEWPITHSLLFTSAARNRVADRDGSAGEVFGSSLARWPAGPLGLWAYGWRHRAPGQVWPWARCPLAGRLVALWLSGATGGTAKPDVSSAMRICTAGNSLL